MLVEEVEAPAAQHYMPVEAHPGASQIQAFEAMLKEAQRPMFIIGGTRWSEEAVAGFQDFASRFKVPVGCSFRRQMLFDHLHPSYAGAVGIGIKPPLAKELTEADRLVLVGDRKGVV